MAGIDQVVAIQSDGVTGRNGSIATFRLTKKPRSACRNHLGIGCWFVMAYTADIRREAVAFSAQFNRSG